MTDTATPMAPADMMHSISVLAGQKHHHFPKDMCGARPLTLVQGQMVLAKLEAAPLRGDVMSLDPPATMAAAPRQDPPRQAARASGPSFRELGAQVPGGAGDRAATYATPSHTGNIDWDFWEVDKGKPGTKWEGYTFVSRVRGGHEPEPVRGREAYIALQEIVKIGVAQAAQNYGRLMRECGFCHISLTKRESRYNGYGAQCAENHDLPYVTPPAGWEDPGEAS
jgi:hypothetical protein